MGVFSEDTRFQRAAKLAILCYPAAFIEVIRISIKNIYVLPLFVVLVAINVDKIVTHGFHLSDIFVLNFITFLSLVGVKECAKSASNRNAKNQQFAMALLVLVVLAFFSPPGLAYMVQASDYSAVFSIGRFVIYELGTATALALLYAVNLTCD